MTITPIQNTSRRAQPDTCGRATSTAMGSWDGPKTSPTNGAVAPMRIYWWCPARTRAHTRWRLSGLRRRDQGVSVSCARMSQPNGLSEGNSPGTASVGMGVIGSVAYYSGNCPCTLSQPPRLQDGAFRSPPEVYRQTSRFCCCRRSPLSRLYGLVCPYRAARPTTRRVG